LLFNQAVTGRVWIGTWQAIPTRSEHEFHQTHTTFGLSFSTEDVMIVEMRTYKTKAGARERFLHLFETVSIPEHRRLGMPITGPFLSVEDPDTFVFMRGFPDMESREALKKGFYDGRVWKDQLERELMPLLESYDVVTVDDRDARLA
jgi:hypothetical protein